MLPPPGDDRAENSRDRVSSRPGRPGADSPGAAPAPDPGPEIPDRFDAGRAAWPGIALDPTVFGRHLMGGDGLPPRERSADLYIACACAEGIPAAFEAFARHYRGVVARAIARIDPSDAFLDEVLQGLSVKLFVRRGHATAGIAQYRGRSTLGGWLATAARRTALNLRRRKGDLSHDELASGLNLLNDGVDPEHLLFKARYKKAFEAAIRAALAALAPDERTLLLLQIEGGMNLSQLAAMHRVSRATLARRLAGARRSVFESTRRELSALGLTASDCRSLLALVRSQLEVSLAAIARDGGPLDERSRARGPEGRARKSPP